MEQQEPQNNEAAETTEAAAEAGETEITYHAVEKDGVVTAIWEMQGRKHLRTIDPRSEEGRHLLGGDEAGEHHG